MDNTQPSFLQRVETAPVLVTDGLGKFRNWKNFLPRGPSTEIEHTATYIRERNKGNGKFFEQERARLTQVRHHLSLLARTGASSASEEISEALPLVLSGQWIAVGFLHNREYHKAISLGKLCVEVAQLCLERCPEGREAEFDLDFWCMLCLLNLGNAYSRFRKYDEADALLKQCYSIRERACEGGEAAGPREGALAAASHSVACKIVLAKQLAAAERRKAEGHAEQSEEDAELLREAVRHAHLAVTTLEEKRLGHGELIFETSWDEGEKADQAAVLASAYSDRGLCEGRSGNLDSALDWLHKARGLAAEFTSLGEDIPRLVQDIDELIKTMTHLMM